MGWLSSILGVSYSSATTPSAADDFWYGQAGHMTAAGVRVSPDIAMKISAVYACVNLLAKIVASLPLLMYERTPTKSRQEALGHPLYQILEYQPNAWQTGFDFKATMMAHAALRGNAIAEIISGSRGAVDRLEPIHPDRIELVERLTDGTLRFTVAPDPWLPGDRRRVLLQDEVFHIRAPIQAGPLGVSPITFARQTMGLALAAEEHGARMFSNGVRPTGIVQMKGTLSDKAFDRFKGEFRAAYQGLQNAGKVPILEGGAEFKPVQLTADEVQFLGTREFQIEEICFVPGTEIITPSGPRPIESIRKDTLVLTHRGRWRKVTNTMRRDYVGPVVRAQAKGLPPVTATANHPFFVQKIRQTRAHKQLADGEPVWLEAGALLASRRQADGQRARGAFHALTIPRLQDDVSAPIDMADWAPATLVSDGTTIRTSGNPRATSITRHIPLSYDLGWLCGLFAADGSTSEHQTVFYIGAHEPEVTARLRDGLSRVFGATCTTTRAGNVDRTVVSHRILAHFFKSLGSVAHEKSLPPWGMSGPMEIRRGMLDGVVAGDGCYYDGRIQLRTTSRSLAWQARTLLWAEGKNSTMQVAAAGQAVINGRTCATREMMTVEWRQEPKRRGSMGCAETHVFFNLEEVKRSTYAGPVFNLEVEEDESYTTVGGCVHNCRWFDVPPVLLHHSTKSTSWGTGVEAIMLAFVRNNLAPWLVAWEQAIRRDLILAPNRYYAEWDVQKLIRGDSRALAEFLTRLVLAGIITRNEARDVLGYDPKDGLDEPLTPSNTTTSDTQPGNGQQSPPGQSPAAALGHNGGPPMEEDSAP